MTPTWVTVLVAVIAGLASGVLGTMLRISHDRGAELRSRMVDAADEFGLAVVAAQQRMRSIVGEVLRREPPLQLVNALTGWYTAEFRHMIDEANADVGDVLMKQSRIHLLFGDPSPAGVAATAVGHHLRLMESAITARPDSVRDHDTFANYSRNFDVVRGQLETFNRAALDALRDTTPRRLLRWFSAAPGRLWQSLPWSTAAMPPAAI